MRRFCCKNCLIKNSLPKKVHSAYRTSSCYILTGTVVYTFTDIRTKKCSSNSVLGQHCAALVSNIAVEFCEVYLQNGPPKCRIMTVLLNFFSPKAVEHMLLSHDFEVGIFRNIQPHISTVMLRSQTSLAIGLCFIYQIRQTFINCLPLFWTSRCRFNCTVFLTYYKNETIPPSTKKFSR